ncbi:MAG: M48 family metallopeptidase [Burkholderiaceae bacterium]
MIRIWASCLAALFLLAATPGHAQVTEPQPQGQVQIPAAARPSADFDIERATRAYLDTIPAAERAKSNAYFEGGYWLQLWGLLYGLGIAALLLFGRISARLRNFAERVTRRPSLQALIYAAGYIVLITILSLPLSFYQEYFREHQYGMSNQTFAAWVGDSAKGLLVFVIVGSLVLALIYTFVRRSQGNWWLPATVISIVSIFLLVFLAPVFISPLFNDFRPLGAGPVRDSVLSLARANGIRVDNVYWFDASKQTKRISANVSGFGNTMRISLNDNLLATTSVPEIKAVMAHEMGHYVLNHSLKYLLQLGLVMGIGFALIQWAQRRLLARWGARWDVRGPTDVAGIPLVVALLSLWFFVMTPVTNSIIRIHESEADIFGLNAAREPHGFASTAMRISNYRKLDPSPLEEMLMFDHPSGATRVRMAMTWLKENPDAGAAAQPGAPRQ